jgi:HD-like signal output (HDOD) protein
MSLTQQQLSQEINTSLARLSADIKNNKLEIPSPPSLLLKLRAVTENENSTIKELSDVIKLDPNISGRIIKVANSVLFGGRVPVNTTQAAITRLGIKKVKNLVISLVIGQNFISNKVKGLEADLINAWHQSNTVAAMAYIIAREKTALDPEQALLAGMVHNIGVLPLIIRINSIAAIKHNPTLLSQVAKIIIPKLYPKAGKLILDNWRFSTTLSDIALTHHSLPKQPEHNLQLNELIAVCYQLSTLNNLTDEERIPENLVSSACFQKVWTTWPQAVSELKLFTPDIMLLKSEIEN